MATVDRNEEQRRRKVLEQYVGGQSMVVDRYMQKMNHLNSRDFDSAIMGLFQGGGPGAPAPPQMTQRKIPGLNPPGGPSYAEGTDAGQVNEPDLSKSGPPGSPMGQRDREGNIIPDENDPALQQADKQALESFRRRMQKEAEIKRQEQERANRPHWADEWEQIYKKPFGRYGEVASEKIAEDAGDTGDIFSARSTGWNKYITRMTEQERQQEMKFLSPRVEAFEAMRQQLTEQYDRMDPVARSHYNDMQKRAMGIEKAFGEKRINPLEYMRAMDELNSRAKQIKWKYHFRAPGAQPGEIVEQEGIKMMRNDKGGLDPIAYTPEFIQQNTIKLANGKIAVPLQPGKGYEIMDPEDMTDPEVIKTDGKDFKKLFLEQWDTAMEEYVKENGATPEGEELVNFEGRVRAQALSMMEMERSAIEQLHARSKERFEARKNGQPIQQKDILEEEMDQQYQAAQSKHDQALNQHQQAQQMDLQQKEQQHVLNLVVQHTNMFGIPQQQVARAIQSGYNPQSMLKSLGLLNQLKHEYPHAKSANDLPPEVRAQFQQAVALLKQLKGS